MSHTKGFAAKYNCSILLHWEDFQRPQDAIGREKQLKNWKRAWKLALIQQHNPDMKDLLEE